MFTFPFQISGNSGFEENLNELTSRHDVLWDEINVPISVMSEFFWRFLFLLEQFPEVGKIDRGALSTIERISIDMKDFFT